MNPTKYRGPSGFSLSAIWADVQIAWKLFWDDRVPFLTKLILPLALLYVVSPIDFVPDFIPGLGQLDDLSIVVLALTAFLKLAPHPIVEEWRNAIMGIDPNTVIIDQPDEQEYEQPYHQ